MLKERLEASEKAVSAVPGNVNRPQNKLRSVALYWKATHLGKWGETKGVLTSLSKWPELKRTCEEIISLRQSRSVWYGADRILGRAYHKLPSTFGGKTKALSHLERSFSRTQSKEYNTSVMGLNVIYLAETYIALRKVSEAREILNNFIAADAQKLNVERLPETYTEQEQAREILKSL